MPTHRDQSRDLNALPRSPNHPFRRPSQDADTIYSHTIPADLATDFRRATTSAERPSPKHVQNNPTHPHPIPPSISDASKIKTKKGVFKFLTLKEPSTSAWEHYAQQQRVEAALRGTHPAGLSSRKLPAEVPKVNSKWDGMPKAASEKKADSLSMKRTSESSNKRSGESRTASPTLPAPTPRSSSTKRVVMLDETPRQITRTKPPSADTTGRRPPNMDNKLVESRARPDSNILIVPAMSTDTLTQDDEETEDRGGIPTTSLFWHDSFSPGDKAQVVSGASQPDADEFSQQARSTPQAPHLVASDTSSPYMPQTPEESESISAAAVVKVVSPPVVRHSREPSLESGAQWPLPTPEDAYSDRSSISDAAPPSIPMRHFRRTSSEPLQHLCIASVNDTEERDRLGGSLSRNDGIHAAPATRRHSRGGHKSPDEVNFTRMWSDSEGEVDDLEAYNIPRHKPRNNSRSPTLRPGSAGHISTESNDGTSATSPETVRSPVRSFSRPLPYRVTTPPSRQTSASAMGTLSIYRNNQPIFSTQNTANRTILPPRFQPGRVVVKDSDLDTIAETDSMRSMSTRRQSYASTIDADVPRHRKEDFSPRPKDDDPVDDDGLSLRTSMYASSDSDAEDNGQDEEESENEYDNDDGEEEEEEEDGTDVTPSARNSYYANPVDPHSDSGDETETEADHTVIPEEGSILGRKLSEVSMAESQLSRTSTASAMSAQWHQSPRERLGLGGFIRHSSKEVPWTNDEKEDDMSVVGGLDGAGSIRSGNSSLSKSPSPVDRMRTEREMREKRRNLLKVFKRT